MPGVVMFPKTTIPRPSHGGSLIGVRSPRSPGTPAGRGRGAAIVGGGGTIVGGAPGGLAVIGGAGVVAASGGRGCNVSGQIELGWGGDAVGDAGGCCASRAPMNATTPTANRATRPPTMSAARRDIENAAASLGLACFCCGDSSDGAGVFVASCVSSPAPP